MSPGTMNLPSPLMTCAPFGRACPLRPILVILFPSMPTCASRTGAPPLPSMSVPPSITRTAGCTPCARSNCRDGASITPSTHVKRIANEQPSRRITLSVYETALQSVDWRAAWLRRCRAVCLEVVLRCQLDDSRCSGGRLPAERRRAGEHGPRETPVEAVRQVDRFDADFEPMTRRKL